ncbi:MAG: AAA family ATPase [Candidatus Thermoplasmatota archaeon]|nr:AAA family ATPase [Candidatus Sysuiplasma jiujiangense]MBX8642028.1 AAA family ATPase [Candidatus Sysuiplasma jiujiangense]MCL4317981.1 AAA family ATPase [Candidatus Thermoplasmatota archaeon]MCL5253060.1 AAA family ATPase [Candidatus Thermoplasmatota archaeon]
MIITVSGPAGSGKTTLASLISGKLGYKLISTGSIFRQIASERGIGVVEMNLLAESDYEIDIALDKRVVAEAARQADCVVEGRLSCHMIKRAGLSALSVFLDASFGTRMERISERDGITYEEAVRQTLMREESEKRRYLKIYGIDRDDMSCYDAVLDSTAMLPDELAENVMRRLYRE